MIILVTSFYKPSDIFSQYVYNWLTTFKIDTDNSCQQENVQG